MVRHVAFLLLLLFPSTTDVETQQPRTREPALAGLADHIAPLFVLPREAERRLVLSLFFDGPLASPLPEPSTPLSAAPDPFDHALFSPAYQIDRLALALPLDRPPLPGTATTCDLDSLTRALAQCGNVAIPTPGEARPTPVITLTLPPQPGFVLPVSNRANQPAISRDLPAQPHMPSTAAIVAILLGVVWAMRDGPDAAPKPEPKPAPPRRRVYRARATRPRHCHAEPDLA